jgi:pyridoxamine 5'-phosphate oxidase
MADKPIRDMRVNYSHSELLEKHLEPDPIRQFRKWFDDACYTDMREPNAMTLATADEKGRPSARIVLLKGFDEKGFVFYTNYDSTKGLQMAANPNAALCFWWPPLERQVRIQGKVEQLGIDESESYFRARPRASRIAAVASPQSRVLSDRSELEQAFERVEAEFAHREIPRPENWGGYVVVPAEVEFWQGRPNRMHDRIRYVRESDGWRIERLAP